MSELAYQQFSTIVPFVFILFLGYLCGKSKLINGDSVKTFGHITYNFLTPFVVINFLQQDRSSRNGSELMWAIFSAIIIFASYYLLAHLLFLRKEKDNSGIYACSLCSTAVSILAYPLLSNIQGINAGLYSAMYIFVNHLLFNILAGKVLYSKRSLIRRIITLPFLIEVLGIAMYFLKLGMILPFANTVSYISDVVPIISVFLMGMHFSSFPASGFKFQFEILMISVFKLMLFPALVFGVCLLAHPPMEIALMFIVLAGLPCGIELSCITSFAQSQKISSAATITAFSFVLSLVSIPMLTFTFSEIYPIIN